MEQDTRGKLKSYGGEMEADLKLESTESLKTFELSLRSSSFRENSNRFNYTDFSLVFLSVFFFFFFTINGINFFATASSSR